jgi:NADH-quinone oxidoreductase subunit C
LSSTDDLTGDLTGERTDARTDALTDELRGALGELLVDHHVEKGDLWLRVRTDGWAQAGRTLKLQGFEYFCFLSGLDWKPSPFGRGEDDPTAPPPERDDTVRAGYAGGDSRFQVFARVTDIARHVSVTLKADVPEDTLTIDTWVPTYAGANWHEREAHEMFGFVFAGHPDLRYLYLPTGFEGHPLRKDFPLLARMVKPWPGIVDVEPMPADLAGESDE